MAVCFQVNSMVLEVNAVDTDVQNAFNHFRSLSNTQFVENVRTPPEQMDVGCFIRSAHVWCFWSSVAQTVPTTIHAYPFALLKRQSSWPFDHHFKLSTQQTTPRRSCPRAFHTLMRFSAACRVWRALETLLHPSALGLPTVHTEAWSCALDREPQRGFLFTM